ncbi:phosphoribosylglycinamide formyltransferase [Phenylobacterium montanum]|uniref:Phosphoribosylglycinamide formyltransferase n=1 Tax=Phenylobacterium montanum TaxID=2823693 RepID=A0A975IWJ1_9CAUL|nr:phosphoribosylglycinamide formyltransferase [Caulobacter sp. S6]QUD88441.1 phosphoribosylglycinamide formyltransferase [Caulobacter sp. S6]
MRKRVGILISGRGTDAVALIRAAAAPDYPAEIALVLSNRPEAPGLERGAEAGVPTLAIDHKPYGKDREAHERAIDAALKAAGVEFVALAGYMRILTPFLVSAWSGRMINVHPALLPAFPGLHTHQRALEAGVKLHGCSVHWVTPGVDEGPLIGQAAVPVLPGDDEERLAARVLAAEHRLYPVCLAAAVTGQAAAPASDAALANPPFA